MNEEKPTLEDTHEKAKKIGHCLCNLAVKCPCTAYLNDKVCVCYNTCLKIYNKKYGKEEN